MLDGQAVRATRVLGCRGDGLRVRRRPPLVWLAPRDPDGDPLRAGSLCKRHADAMVVPLGWTLDDRREPTPRLFRTARRGRRGRAAGSPAAAPPSAAQRRERTRRRSSARRAGRRRVAPTVAEVTGDPLADDDPDATVAIPWLPDVRRRRRPRRGAGRPQPAARPGVPRHRPTALTHRAHVRRRCSSTTPTRRACSRTSTRSTATRRGCGSSTASSRLEPDDGRPAWRVELRARVGPFARSKQLRMVRTVYEPERIARFERIEDDERDHADVDPRRPPSPTPRAGRPS